ncbi:MAG: hypothetical protein II193_09640 [Lachnospiraceae bacterium]|nr:hypothetical protein [Lachnospiraceae bacterium]
MYEVLEMLLVIAAVVLGLFMVICPQKAVKKECAQDEEQIKKTRVKGACIAVLGIVVVIVFSFNPYM